MLLTEKKNDFKPVIWMNKAVTNYDCSPQGSETNKYWNTVGGEETVISI